MNPLSEFLAWLLDWMFSTKAGKFVFITVFGTVVAFAINVILLAFSIISYQLGWPTILGCAAFGIFSAATDKRLTKWF